MRNQWLILSCLWLVSCKTSSSALFDKSPVLPHYNVQKTSDPIKIDGSLSEPAWANAEEILFIYPWAEKETKESVIAKVLWSDDHLYVGYDNVDHYVQAAVKDFDGTVFKDDCVEIFITPDEKEVSQYYGFEMNVLGTMLDYTAAKAGHGPTKAFDYAWNSQGVEIKSVLKEQTTLNNNDDVDQGWVLEMKIPLKNFASMRKNPAEKPHIWRANFNRCKGPERGEYATWSHTHTEKPNFHVSRYFGFLHFMNE